VYPARSDEIAIQVYQSFFSYFWKFFD
jgi:hypothetical protein